jgi:HNH endonuclease
VHFRPIIEARRFSSRRRKWQLADIKPKVDVMKKRSCINCVYAGKPSWFRSYRDTMACWPSSLECVNHPDAPGVLTEVSGAGSCRNFRARRKKAVRTVPPEPPNDAIRYIALTQGRYAIVDAADYEWLNQWKWCAARSGNLWYAYRKHHGKTVRMHQLIMNPPKGMVVDHINGNGLDDRRDNLRICTRRQNAWNHGRRKADNASSEFLGVYRRKEDPDKCYVRVTRDGQATNLGPFDTEIQAAQARDQKACELHGEFAYLNFPEALKHEDGSP